MHQSYVRPGSAAAAVPAIAATTGKYSSDEILVERIAAGDKLGIRLAHSLDDSVDDVQEGRFPAPQQPGMSHRPPEDPTEDVSSPLVGREDAVRQKESGGPGMVGQQLGRSHRRCWTRRARNLRPSR